MAKNVVSEEHIIDSDDYMSEEELGVSKKTAAAEALEKTLAIPKGYHTHKSNKNTKKALKGGKKFVLIRVPKGLDIKQVKKLKSGMVIDGEQYNVSSVKNQGQPLNVINGHVRGNIIERLTVTKKVQIPNIQYDKVIVPRKDVEVVKF